MSTCRGAAAPHDNCPHGENCDWDPNPSSQVAPPPKPLMVEMNARMKAFGSDRGPNNRAERRKLQRAAKSVRREMTRGSHH